MSYRENAAEDRSVLVMGLNGRLIGFDAHSGAHRWEHNLDKSYGEVEIIVHAGRVFASAGHEVMCISYPDGRLLGKSGLPGKYKGRPTMLLEGSRLFIATGGELCCFDLDGQLLWHDGLKGKGIGSMSLGFPDNTRPADDVGSK